jgi:hypothetical protein
MTRRRLLEIEDAPPPTAEIDVRDLVPPDVLPSDAEDLAAVVDRRFKHLLASTMEAKDMVKALEAATKWWEVRHGTQQGAEWGSALGRTTRNE